jgi:Zn-dependent protease with chaperone function/tellurite resistance protein
MNADALRARSDRELAEKLLEDRAVQAVVERIRRIEDQGPGGVRRRLLATSVRLGRAMAPGVHAMADECAEKLGLDIPIELYVFPGASFNAACVKPEAGRLFVMFSSSLLEGFEDGELRFVMGHELGHHLYGHHDIPIGHILRGAERPPASLALQLFAWSRYAEISADRAGAHCAGDLEVVARALFKLASGLVGDVVAFRLDEFLRQVDEMETEDAEPGRGAPMEDWFSTHPFSPLRVKALALYDRSELARPGGGPLDTLEAGVQMLMGLMEPSYIESRTEVAETMRRLLFAGAIAVADVTGGITEREVKVFEGFFGAGALSEELDIARIKDSLEERIASVRDGASHGQRTQVVRDLCLVARADCPVSKAEQEVINRIAIGLDISPTFVACRLDADVELD